MSLPIETDRLALRAFVHRDYWGRGIASEIVRAALAQGFGAHGLPRTLAFARRGNGASQRVLDNAGFRFCAYEPSLERNRYEIASAEWLARSAASASDVGSA